MRTAKDSRAKSEKYEEKKMFHGATLYIFCIVGRTLLINGGRIKHFDE
jgi:hypothetical protein